MGTSASHIPGVDPKLLIRDAAKLLPEPSRRLFLRGAASLGALAVLIGLRHRRRRNLGNALRVISTFNDRVQALLFNPKRWRRNIPESAITRPFPFNAYYSEDDAPDIDGDHWQLEIGGLVDNKKPWTLPELYKLPEVSQITRHVLRRRLERDRVAGRASSCRDFLKLIGADTRAKYVLVPVRARAIPTPLDMPTALHPQTQLTLKFDHQILPRAYGFPMKIRIPTKLGFKNPKYVTAMWVQNNDAGGYWENQGYNWFSGL